MKLHIDSDVSKANVAFYKGALYLALSYCKLTVVPAGGLSKPLDQQDIRIYTEHRAEN